MSTALSFAALGLMFLLLLLQNRLLLGRSFTTVTGKGYSPNVTRLGWMRWVTFAICIIGLAMVEKDGLAVLVGFAVGAFSLVVAGTVVIGLLHAFFLLLSSLAG
jgi:ABC-type Fe3+ transport system permease subunit